MIIIPPSENTYALEMDTKRDRLMYCKQVIGYIFNQRSISSEYSCDELYDGYISNNNFNKSEMKGISKTPEIYATRGSFTVTDDSATRFIISGCYHSINDFIKKLSGECMDLYYNDLQRYSNGEKTLSQETGRNYDAVRWVSDNDLFDKLEIITGLVYDRELLQAAKEKEQKLFRIVNKIDDSKWSKPLYPER